MTIATYARVSTGQQDYQAQVDRLREAGAARVSMRSSPVSPASAQSGPDALSSSVGQHAPRIEDWMHDEIASAPTDPR